MRTRGVAKVVTVALTVGLLVVLSACGGDGGSDASGATSTTKAEAADRAAPSESTAPTGGGASDAASVCEVIRTVQADLGAGAVPAAYQAQVTIKLDPSLYRAVAAGELDGPTRQSCPAEYQQYLTQAGIPSLSGL